MPVSLVNISSDGYFVPSLSMYSGQLAKRRVPFFFLAAQ